MYEKICNLRYLQFDGAEIDYSCVSREAKVPDQFSFNPGQNTIIEKPFNYNPDNP